jgi:hypothetical protein
MYTVGTIATQSSALLPLSIPGPFVNGPLGPVLPVAKTPTVCFPAGTFITVISGGTCTLNYSSPATTTYLASDVYPLTFEISRTTQTVTFSAQSSVKLSAKVMPLVAAASSGLPVVFQSDSPSICIVTGNSLNLVKPGNCVVEAIQSGSTTIAPRSFAQTIVVTPAPTLLKKITCIKAGRTMTFIGSKCPAGFKAKK